MDNIILVDWLSVTFKGFDVSDIKGMLGMYDVPWDSIKGARGYVNREYYGGISIHYDPPEENEYKVWLEMSGQGCRTFETYGENTYLKLFAIIIDVPGVHVTRLDVAFDDHTGIFDLNQIADQLRNAEYTSITTNWRVEFSNKGTTCYIGSEKSNLMIRIYDKARERGCEDGEHWVRLELQLRDQHAYNFLQETSVFYTIEQPGFYPVGQILRGVVYRYIQFRDKNETDSNKARWPLSEWYTNFLEAAEKISIGSKPGVEYNIIKCQSYVVDQAGQSIDAFIRCVGPKTFLQMVEKKAASKKRNPKYEMMIKEYMAARGLDYDTKTLYDLSK